MAPPPSQECGNAECQYSTPEGVPSWELVVELLRMHRQDVHPQAQQPPQVGDQAASAKPRAEKVPRPQIKLGVSQDEFSYFQDEWTSYKRSCGITDETENFGQHVMRNSEETFSTALVQN